MRIGDKTRMFIKGAPEIVINYCTKFSSAEGESGMDKEARDDVINNRVVKKFADKCYRCILVAYKDFSDDEWNQLSSQYNSFKEPKDLMNLENDFTMVGIFGILDPLRPGIADAVDQCHRSGINVRMITGDNIDTAIAISKEAHILKDEEFADFEKGNLSVCMTH